MEGVRDYTSEPECSIVMPCSWMICHEVPVSLRDVPDDGYFHLNRFWGPVCKQTHAPERNGLSIKGGLLGNLSVCSIDSSDRSPGNVSAMQNPRPFPQLTQTLHLPKFPDGSVHSKAWKVGPSVFLSGLLRMRNSWVSARRLSLLHTIAGGGYTLSSWEPGLRAMLDQWWFLYWFWQLLLLA